jgi:circadian clock protein KaiC
VREFRLTSSGVALVNVEVGPQGVLVGTARATHQASQVASQRKRELEATQQRKQLDRKRKVIESQIAALQAEIESEEEHFRQEQLQEQDLLRLQQDNRTAEASARQGRIAGEEEEK